MRSLVRKVMTAAVALISVCSYSGAYASSKETCPNRTVAEQRNLDAMMEFYFHVIHPLDIDRFKEFVAPTYIEHYPGLAGNLESLKKFFGDMKQKYPHGLSDERLVLATVDGDLVTLIVERNKTPISKESSGLLGVEIFRVKDGKQIEHWEEHVTPPAE